MSGPLRRKDSEPNVSDALLTSQPHGSFDELGTYTAPPVVEDDLAGESFEDAIDRTIVDFDDGDIVKGTVVRVDKDEVLLDIGYKSEGVIPSRELSIRHDVDPRRGRQHG